MNLPNKITVARIFVSVVVLVMLLIPWEQLGIMFPVYTIDGNIIVDLKILIAGGLFVLGSFTDFLDGHIARSRNIVTDFGKVMDSIADKILLKVVWYNSAKSIIISSEKLAVKSFINDFNVRLFSSMKLFITLFASFKK